MATKHMLISSIFTDQNELEDHLKGITSYLVTESRRAEIKFKPAPIDELETEDMPDTDKDGGKENLTDFLYKVHQTTRSTLVKFDRCKEVIEKLHNDCDNVAQKNTDMLNKLRECEDVVLEMMPAHLQQSKSLVKYEAGGEADRSRANSRASFDDNASGTPRLKMTEAEKIMFAIRGHLGQIGDYLKQNEVDRDSCSKILDRMVDDVKERRGVLGKAAEAPLAKINSAKYVESLPPIKVTSVPSLRAQLRPKLELFADQFQDYVQHESQVTHKMNVNKYQAGLAHRQFDQIDGDLGQLQREMRRNDRERAMVLAKHIVDVTKAEREDCLKMVEEVERSVRTRRQNIQATAQYDKTKGRRKRPQFQRVRFLRKVDSNFSKRLNDLNNEVKVYIDTESEQMTNTRGELSKKKVEFESQVRSKQTEIKSLETKLREMTTDRDKFRMLYNKEKTMMKAKIITKPTIPKRDVKQGPLPPIRQGGNTTRRVGLSAAGPVTRPGRASGTTLTSLSSMAAPRGEPLSTRGRSTGRPVGMVKPRLTPRARDLKGLKDNLKAKKKMARIKPLNLIPEIGEDETVR